MFNKITFKSKIIILSILLLFIGALYLISLNYGFKFLYNKPSENPDINVATPSGTVTFNLVKLTADPIYPNTKVKYAVRVSVSGSANVTALGFKIKSTLPISNYVLGTPIVSGIQVKEFNYDSAANTLAFVAATSGWFQIGNGNDLITFDLTAPSTAGTYNSVLTNVTTAALPSLIDTNNNEILNSNSLSPVSLIVQNPIVIPSAPSNFKNTCAADGKSATFSWSAPSGAVSYYFRLDYTEGGVFPGGPNDYVKDNFTETSVSYPVVPGKNYHAWVHAANSAGIGNPADIASFSCTEPNPAPVGNLDSVNCQEISGWSCDGSNYSGAVEVHVYADGPYGTGTMVAQGNANTSRSDVTSYCGGTASHGYIIPFPASLMDGKSHTIYTHAIDIPSGTQNPVLPNSGKSVTCYPAPTAAPANLKATCSTDGTQVTISWNAVSGAAKYFLRNDNTTNGWPGGAGDLIDDNVTTTSKVVSITPSTPYRTWVHGVSSTGAVGPYSEITYSCNKLVPTPTPSPSPTPVKVSTPTLSLRAGAYIYYANSPLENKSVTLTSLTSGATIQYCVGSITSTTCTSYTNYSNPIVVNKNFKLYAKAIKSGSTDSDVATGVYQLLGDLNGDNIYNVASDVIPLLKAIFESSLQNINLMDMNRDNIIDMRDLILLINLIFS